MNIDDRLREQNHLKGWRDCEAAGLKHRLQLPQRVGYNPRAEYWSCRRCPVTIRRTR